MEWGTVEEISTEELWFLRERMFGAIIHINKNMDKATFHLGLLMSYIPYFHKIC